MGFHFMTQRVPDSKLYFPNSTWSMHRSIARRGGINHFQTYPYYNKATNSLDITEMLDYFRSIPNYSTILLHACGHNPTGLDPTPAEWDAIMKVCIEKQHFPFFDLAYQGLASGDLAKDAEVIRKFTEAGLQLFVAQTYSDNLVAYEELIGAAHFVCTDSVTARKVASQNKLFIRRNYGSSPIHGARIVSRIIENPKYYEMWKKDVQEMHARLISTRKSLRDSLSDMKTKGNWDFLLKQTGMYSSLGLNGKNFL
jgi:aspartate/tyrosine/aromatic aminotransferase